MGWRRWLSARWEERHSAERRIQQEMLTHLEEAADDLERTGVPPERARAQARERFGSLEQHFREARRVRVRALRRARRSERTHGLLHDVRFAWRSLRARPRFALAAALMLGAGIGTATLLSSIVDTVLFRPLPFADPEHLVHLRGPYLTLAGGRPFPSTDEQLDWRPRIAQAFEDVAAYHPMPYSVNLSNRGEPVEAGLTEVTGNFFSVLGQRMLLGRYFTSSDAAGDPATRPAVVGERLWRSHWGADPAVVGAEILVDGRPHRVLGVVPMTAQLPASVDVWVVMGESWDTTYVHGARYFRFVGRLRADAAPEVVEADLRGLQADFETLLDGRERPMSVNRLHTDLVGSASAPLWLLLGGIGLLLLIAMANLASYLLVRSRARHSEYCVRAALGAGRRRLLQQSLAESALLSAGGLAVASLLASWAVGLVRSSDLPLPRLESLSVDWRLFSIGLVVSCACAVLFGLGPALYASRPNVAAGLGGDARSGRGGLHRPREILVIGQIALAVVLAGGAGLLGRSYAELRLVDNGFRSDVLTFATRLDDGTFEQLSDAHAFAHTLVDRLRALPTVAEVGASTLLPLAPRNNFAIRYRVDGQPEPPDDAWTAFSAMTPGFADALGVRLLAGRDFTADDREGASPVAIVNRSFVQIHFGTRDPAAALDATLREAASDDGPAFRIVGVLDDLRRGGPDESTGPEVFFPLAQRRQRAEFFAVRPNGDPATVVTAARTIAAELAPTLPLHDLRTMEQRLHRTLTQPRVLAWLFRAFGAASVLLASFGLYAVVTYWVAARRHEIGVRMAVGATGGRLCLRLVAEGSARLGAGLLLGLLAYFLAVRAIDTSLLFGVGVYDPGTLAAVLGAVGAATMIGVAGAARRVVRLDPVEALRSD